MGRARSNPIRRSVAVLLRFRLTLPQTVEADRGRLIGIERLMLETVSFNFNLHAGLESADAGDGGDAGSAGRDAFSYLIKIAKRLGSAF